MTSPTSLGSLSADDFDLSTREADEYAVIRIRNAAFHAVHKLWRRRHAEGLSQQKLAEILERDKGWVSRALSGPANWEFKTFARFIRALNGEAEIHVHSLEDNLEGENYDAYRDNDFGGRLAKSTFTTEPVERRGKGGNVVFITRATA